MEASDVIHEIKDFIRERVRVDCHAVRGSFGSSPYIKVRLMMDDEEISSSTFDMPDDD